MLKRLAFIAVLLIPLFVWSAAGLPTGWQRVTVTDSITVRDTIADSIHADTGITGIMEISEWSELQFGVRVLSDSDFTADSLFVIPQVSPSPMAETCWTALSVIAPFGSNDTTYSSLVVLDTLLYQPDYLRFLCVRWDSNEADVPALVTNTYDAAFEIGVKGFK